MTNSVAYIDRTRAFYEAQGFTKAYQYAENDTAPFAPLPKPLAECRVGLVTTASHYFRENLEPRKVSAFSVPPVPDKLYTDDLSWDKQATHTDDVQSYCPTDALNGLVANNVIGSFSSRVVCSPTEYSQRATTQDDAPQIHDMLLEDEVDVALLVPL